MSNDEDARDLAAAEYALGTLDAREREAAARRRAADPAFDRTVGWWERRLAPLARAIAPVAPSEGLWQRIMTAIDTPSTLGNRDNVVVLRRAVSRWRMATVAAGALAAGLALYVIDRDMLRPGAAPAAGTYFAAVNRNGEMPALVVRVDLATRAVTVRPVELDAPAGKSLELWYIAAGTAPKSMGVVSKERARMPMPTSMDVKGGVFAVSVEPTGGSTTGAPTGPVVYKGMLVAE